MMTGTISIEREVGDLSVISIVSNSLEDKEGGTFRIPPLLMVHGVLVVHPAASTAMKTMHIVSGRDGWIPCLPLHYCGWLQMCLSSSLLYSCLVICEAILAGARYHGSCSLSRHCPGECNSQVPCVWDHEAVVEGRERERKCFFKNRTRGHSGSCQPTTSQPCQRVGGVCTFALNNVQSMLLAIADNNHHHHHQVSPYLLPPFSNSELGIDLRFSG